MRRGSRSVVLSSTGDGDRDDRIPSRPARCPRRDNIRRLLSSLLLLPLSPVLEFDTCLIHQASKARCRERRGAGRRTEGRPDDHVGNLVDSASSHTLVSKIKPCMSKYKRFIL